MKKFFIFFLVFVIVFSFTACSTDDGNTANLVTFTDGTYTAFGDSWQYGQESSTVVIEEGRIVSIDLKRLTVEGNEVDYSKWTGEEIDGKIYPNLKEYRKILASQMIEAQSYKVDVITGATISCENWIIATKRALTKASN